MSFYDIQHFVFELLFSPHPSVKDEAERDSAQFLAIVMLALVSIDVIAILGILLQSGWNTPSQLIVLNLTLALMCYGLARTVWYQTSRILAIITTFLFAIGIMIERMDVLGTIVLIFPVYVVSILTTPRYTLFASIINISIALIFTTQFSDPLRDKILMLGYLLFISMLIFIHTVLLKRSQNKVWVRNQRLAKYHNLQIALEKERELNQLKSNLMSTISHEFRTPLAVIMNNTELLGKYFNRLDEKQRLDRLDGIRVQIRQLTDMLENISQIVQGTTDRLTFKPDLADLDLYAETLFNQIREMLGTKHDMHLKLSGNLRDLYIDVTLIHQTITNLLVNAIKFTPQGSKVFLSIHNDDKYLTIIVRDEGIGIPSEDVEQIFKPFHRASNSETIRGTGLGLTIVKDCVTTHGGTIAVESKLNKGTAFTILIPVVPAPA